MDRNEPDLLSTVRGDMVSLDCSDINQISRLETVFESFSTAMREQEAKLSKKWIDSESRNDTILIDKKHILEYVSQIGLKFGYDIEEEKALSLVDEIMSLLSLLNNEMIEFAGDADKYIQHTKKKQSSLIVTNRESNNNEMNRIRSLTLRKQLEKEKQAKLDEMKQINEQRRLIAAELAKAEPQLLEAREAVKKIDTRALDELLSLQKPPRTVELVLTVAGLILYESEQFMIKESKENGITNIKTFDFGRSGSKRHKANLSPNDGTSDYESDRNSPHGQDHSFVVCC